MVRNAYHNGFMFGARVPITHEGMKMAHQTMSVGAVQGRIDLECEKYTKRIASGELTLSHAHTVLTNLGRLQHGPVQDRRPRESGCLLSVQRRLTKAPA